MNIRTLQAYSATLGNCTHDCDSENECKAFAYSKRNVKCKLVTEIKPGYRRYGDFQFCAKIGFVLYTFITKLNITSNLNSMFYLCFRVEYTNTKKTFSDSVQCKNKHDWCELSKPSCKKEYVKENCPKYCRLCAGKN